MYWRFLRALFCCAFVLTVYAWAEVGNSCVSLREFKAPNVEITKTAKIPPGSTEEKPWGQVGLHRSRVIAGLKES